MRRSTIRTSALRRHSPVSRSSPTRRTLFRRISLGAAQWRDSGRAHHVERGRVGAQAGDVHDQLHGVGYRRRLDGQHPQQGARSRPDIEGRLRHRLRILDAAAQGRLCHRRWRVHVGPAVVHGYLRQDVFHGVVSRRSSWCADGHFRCRSPRMSWSSFGPSAKTAGCDSSTCRIARHGRIHAGRHQRG